MRKQRKDKHCITPLLHQSVWETPPLVEAALLVNRERVALDSEVMLQAGLVPQQVLK
jgi:hypothetical protein